MMRRIPIALLGAAWSLAASGEDLLQCVDPDVKDGLLFSRPNDFGADIRSEVPSGIESLSVPADFTWIASAERASGTTGAFMAAGDPAEVLDAAVNTLAVDGWEVNSIFSPAQPLGGARSRTLCREDEALTVTAQQISSTTYVTYHLPATSANGACAVGSMAQLPLEPHMPRLDFSTLDPNASARGSGGSGSINSIVRSMQLTLAADVDAVAGHLAQQLNEQGWQLDASWAGTVMVGSTWERQTDDRKSLAGTLDVIDRGNSSYVIAFALTELN